jgi:hypothetical protein
VACFGELSHQQPDPATRDGCVRAPVSVSFVRGECLNGNGKTTQTVVASVVLTFTNSPGIPIASVPYIFTSRQNKIGPSVRPGFLEEKMFASDALRQIALLFVRGTVEEELLAEQRSACAGAG